MAFLSTGNITLVTTGASVDLVPETAEVVFGVLAAGSSVGANATNASASVNGALTTTTTDLWHLNNSNASAAYYARLVLLNSPSVGSITSMTIGIDNGTADTAQITANLGSLTNTEGTYVRLEPGGTVRIYVTHLVGLTFTAAEFALLTYVADDTGESAVYTIRANLALT